MKAMLGVISLCRRGTQYTEDALDCLKIIFSS